MAGETLLRLSNGQKKALSNVLEGDELFSVSKGGRSCITATTRSDATGFPVYTFKLGNGESVTVSPNHIFLLNNGVPIVAEELRRGDKLAADIGWVEVANLEYTPSLNR